MNSELTANTESDNHSAIGRLLDALIKHGTMPNMPVPELITDAQIELAGYELRLDLLAKGATWEHEENARLRDELTRLRDNYEASQELLVIREEQVGEFLEERKRLRAIEAAAREGELALIRAMPQLKGALVIQDAERAVRKLADALAKVGRE